MHFSTKPFQCFTCNMSFEDLSNLNIHKRIHTEEKPFSCQICQKKFKRLRNLKLHEKIHTGVKLKQENTEGRDMHSK